MANPLKPTPEPTKQSTKQLMEKQNELRYAKALSKNKAEGSSRPYHFNILAQLANIPARITLYELLGSKSIREDLREALADAEVFMAWILAEPREKDEENYLHASQHAPYITFTPDNMHVKGKHDRPLYFTRHIRSSEMSRIKVDQDPR